MNGGYNWTVQLPLGLQLNHTLQVDSTYLKGQGQPQVSVAVTRNGTRPLSGNVTFGYRHTSQEAWMMTSTLPYDADASTVAKALSNLNGR
jgi:hypothetical protein